MKDRLAILEQIRLQSLTKNTYVKQTSSVIGTGLSFLLLETGNKLLQENNGGIKI